MKLLASDYDGTLQFGDSVMESDLEALRKWKEEGNLFALVTGRSKQSICQMMEKYGIPADYLVTNNGGMVFDAEGNDLLSSQLDTTTAIDLMFIAHELGDVVSYMVNDGVNRHKVVCNPGMKDHRYPHVQPDWSEEQIMDSGQFSQIVYSMNDPKAAVDTADHINHYFGSVVNAYPNGFVVDIVHNGISKATGLQFVQEYCNADDDDLFVIGDSYNDIPMLEGAVNSAAMIMAPEEVKGNARWEYMSIEDYVKDITEGKI